LELGADDYIVKPFGAKEVIARIRAVARRCVSSPTAKTLDHEMDFEMGDLLIRPKQLRAQRNGQASIELTPRDLRILMTLHRCTNEVVHRHDLFREAWGAATVPSSRTLDQTISNLRKRIERDPANPVIVQTVYGVGYRYCLDKD
jgi:DNA-binding response OmpR family regulator